jgi:hypothetical protein
MKNPNHEFFNWTAIGGTLVAIFLFVLVRALLTG